MLPWQANVRAIALTLQALRAVDRYGAVHSAEQYRGFMAIESGPVAPFANADEALLWMRQVADAPTCTPRSAYRVAVRRLHPTPVEILLSGTASTRPGSFSKLPDSCRTETARAPTS